MWRRVASCHLDVFDDTTSVSPVTTVRKHTGVGQSNKVE